ncbi:MAG: glycosyltransferase family 4 protein [Desulfuromonadaceae bacterium]
MNGRLKILVSAYACSPYKGSEGAVGWGFVSALSRLHDLWVIVEEEKFRSDIERYQAENPEKCSSTQFIFLPKKRNRLLRKIWPPSYYYYYHQWHLDAFDLAKDLHRDIRFDIVHQLTMVGFREPGYLWQLGIPFVWGPIGGMGLFPWRFLTSVGWYGAFYYMGYNLYNLLQMNFQKRPRLAAQTAGNGLITATPENQTGALKYWDCPSTLISEVGLPPVTTKKLLRRNTGEPLRIVWTGQHTPGKALNLALHALGSVPANLEWELHILGKGKRTEKWKLFSKQLGLADRCHFHGWLERDTAMNIMDSAHVMLITSLRDLTSTVTIEALALGLPIICLNHCGFAHVVDDTCGIKVPVTTPTEVVAGLAGAIVRLAQNEELRLNLAKGAERHARNFSWHKKVEVVNAIYMRKLDEVKELSS